MNGVFAGRVVGDMGENGGLENSFKCGFKNGAVVEIESHIGNGGGFVSGANRFVDGSGGFANGFVGVEGGGRSGNFSNEGGGAGIAGSFAVGPLSGLVRSVGGFISGGTVSFTLISERGSNEGKTEKDGGFHVVASGRRSNQRPPFLSRDLAKELDIILSW